MLFNGCDTGHSWWAHGGFFITIVVFSLYEILVYKFLLVRIKSVREKVNQLPDEENRKLGRNFVYRYSKWFFLLAGILFKIDFYTDLCFVRKLYECQSVPMLIKVFSTSSLCFFGAF